MSSSYLTAKKYTSFFSKSYSTPHEINQITPEKGSVFLMGDHNTHKIMTSIETRLTVAISSPIISEGLSFSLAQKPCFKKVIDLAKNVKRLSTFKKQIVAKDIMDIIHDQNMQSNLSLIKKESDIFGLFL